MSQMHPSPGRRRSPVGGSRSREPTEVVPVVDELEGGAFTTPARPFRSSKELFAWLSQHLADEGALTSTELQICELLLIGRRYAEIASCRGTSLETVKWHVRNILEKLRLDSTREFLWLIGHRLDLPHDGPSDGDGLP